MVVKDYYEYFDNENYTQFYFVSEGQQGKIPKIILFEKKENGAWNLGFGDIRNGRIDSSSVSNNNDLRKVIGTVVKATKEFIMMYPDAVIEIRPVDDRRKNLYNRVFQQRFDEISRFFELKGYLRGLEEEGELYQPNVIYNAFSLKLNF